MIYETPLSRVVKAQKVLPTGEHVVVYVQAFRVDEKVEDKWTHRLIHREIQAEEE